MIAEDPVKIVQVVTFDEDAGLRTVEVPKHLNLMKTLHVTDLNDERLTLQVYDEVEACYIGKPRQHLNHKEEKEALGNFTQMFESHKLFSSRNAAHEELIFLPGATIAHDELPPKLRSYCPANYRIQTFRYIEKNSHLVSESQSGEMILQDPEIQKDYKDGDIVMKEEDLIPDGLDHVKRRVKRRAPTCRTFGQSGEMVDTGCLWVGLSCNKARGCPATHVFYKCRPSDGPRWVENILLCSTYNNSRCQIHVTHTRVVCEQCCISDDCGPSMQKCKPDETQVDSSTRKLKLTLRLGDFATYENMPASIAIFYKGTWCSTNMLPTSLPHTGSRRKQTIYVDTRASLGMCWYMDLSGGDPESMRIQLVLPENSPIAVSKATVHQEGNTQRCWTIKWKNNKYNQQNGQWIYGDSLYYDDDCETY